MRTEIITRNIYTFDELSDDAKEKAIERFRRDLDYLAWQSESADTVKEIAEKMSWRWSYESYDGIRYDVKFSIDDGDVSDLSGKRAMAYIVNNYINRAEQPKTYWLHHVLYCDGRKNWTRESRIWRTIDDCPFTGYIMDCCFAEAWRDWKKQFSVNSTVQDFADLVAEKLARDWTADNEYQISDDGIIELIEANEYEFTEDGAIC